jgi:hypothetical protein
MAFRPASDGFMNVNYQVYYQLGDTVSSLPASLNYFGIGSFYQLNSVSSTVFTVETEKEVVIKV